MKNKRGYMKTLEAVFSVILMLIIVLTIISFNRASSGEVPNEIQNLQDIILGEIQNDESLREKVYVSAAGELEGAFSEYIDSNRLDYKIQICEDIDYCEPSDLINDYDVFVDSIIIHNAGYSFLVRLYIWYNA